MIACRQSAAGEPLAGTAPSALAWLIVEHPGPWGSQATDVLPEAVSSRQDEGIRCLVARHPARPARDEGLQRYAWLAYVDPMSPQLMRRDLADAGELVALDWTAIVRGDLGSFQGTPCDTVAFVCTNGSRDACCAVVGRPVLAEVLQRISDPLRAWECSHIGGHRFAPVALTLPTAIIAGRVTADDVVALLEGNVMPDKYRGRSFFEPHIQAAEGALLRAGEGFALSYQDVGSDRVRATLINGRLIDIEVTMTSVPDRPESCGTPAKPAQGWQATLI